jgi:DnaJ-class molecular chaperone
MTRESAVLVRESCPDCGGEGKTRVERSVGHASWGKRETCPACEGAGHRSRWVAISELARRLDEARAPGEG